MSIARNSSWLIQQAQDAEKLLRSLPPELLSPVARAMLTAPALADESIPSPLRPNPRLQVHRSTAAAQESTVRQNIQSPLLLELENTEG